MAGGSAESGRKLRTSALLGMINSDHCSLGLPPIAEPTLLQEPIIEEFPCATSPDRERHSVVRQTQSEESKQRYTKAKKGPADASWHGPDLHDRGRSRIEAIRLLLRASTASRSPERSRWIAETARMNGARFREASAFDRATKAKVSEFVSMIPQPGICSCFYRVHTFCMQ